MWSVKSCEQSGLPSAKGPGRNLVAHTEQPVEARAGVCVLAPSHQGGFPGAVALWRGTQHWPTLPPTSLSLQSQSLPWEAGSAGSRLER